MLGCVLLAVGAGSQAEVDAMLGQLKPSLFYGLHEREVFQPMASQRAKALAGDGVNDGRDDRI